MSKVIKKANMARINGTSYISISRYNIPLEKTVHEDNRNSNHVSPERKTRRLRYMSANLLGLKTLTRRDFKRIYWKSLPVFLNSESARISLAMTVYPSKCRFLCIRCNAEERSKQMFGNGFLKEQTSTVITYASVYMLCAIRCSNSLHNLHAAIKKSSAI